MLNHNTHTISQNQIGYQKVHRRAQKRKRVIFCFQSRQGGRGWGIAESEGGQERRQNEL